MGISRQIFNNIFCFFKGFSGIDHPGITKQIVEKGFINRDILLFNPLAEFFNIRCPEDTAQGLSRIKILTLLFGSGLKPCRTFNIILPESTSDTLRLVTSPSLRPPE